MRFLRKPFQIIRANWRLYLIMNLIMYSVVLIGFGVGLAFPELTSARVSAMEGDGTAEMVQSLLSSPWLFALTILGVNTLRLAALTIILPSMIVPFAGIVAFVVWAVTTGVTLVPADSNGWVALIPHTPTVIIEFQAYILILVGVYLLGKFWLRPQSISAQNRRHGYLRGLQHLGWLSLPALALLVIGAVYEAFSLIYLVHPLQEWLL